MSNSQMIAVAVYAMRSWCPSLGWRSSVDSLSTLSGGFLRHNSTQKVYTAIAYQVKWIGCNNKQSKFTLTKVASATPNSPICWMTPVCTLEMIDTLAYKTYLVLCNTFRCIIFLREPISRELFFLPPELNRKKRGRAVESVNNLSRIYWYVRLAINISMGFSTSHLFFQAFRFNRWG